MKRKLVDFRNIDIRVADSMEGYCNHKGYKFLINNLYIENIDGQLDRLLGLKTELYIGDSIFLDTNFGWYNGEHWLTFPLAGEFRVRGIVSEDEIGEIRLVMKPIKLRFDYNDIEEIQ